MVLLSASGIYTMVTSYIEMWVWEPFWSLIFLLILVVADTIVAIWISNKRAIKGKPGFETNKFRKTLFNVLIYTFILGVMHNLPRVNEEFGIVVVQGIINAFPGISYLYMFCILFPSFLKNIVLLGYFDGMLARFIYKYIDTYKNHVSDKLNTDD